MHPEAPYPLCRVGSGEQTHVLEDNGRPRCENVATWIWKQADGEPSVVHDLTERGRPSCHYCRQAL